MQDSPTGHPTDGLDGEWLTHAELAERRRISKASASRMVRRHKWQRRTDNLSGTVRIFVPQHALEADRPEGVQRAHPADVLVALQTAVETLREALTRAEGRADVLRIELQATMERADQAEGVRDAALEAANRAEAEAQAARDRLADMERDNNARQGRGRWQRLRDAWRRT